MLAFPIVIKGILHFINSKDILDVPHLCNADRSILDVNYSLHLLMKIFLDSLHTLLNSSIL